MKYLLLFLITTYQMFISSLIKQALGIQRLCKFTPTCSDYAKNALRKYGLIKGCLLATKRLLVCQPFSK